MRRKRVPLRPLLDHLLKRAQRGAAEKQVGMRLDCAEGLTVRADPDRLGDGQPGRQRREGRAQRGRGDPIAKELVEAHGGRITAESATGRGAKFTIWLPE